MSGWGSRAVLSGVLFVSLSLISACAVLQQPNTMGVDLTPSAAVPEFTPEIELSVEDQIEGLRIPSGLSSEEYAKTLIEDRLASWYLAGSGPAYWEERGAMGQVSETTYEDEIAAQNANIYANALFVPDWGSNPNLTNAADSFALHNSINLVNWLRAYDFDGSLGTPEWDVDFHVEQVEVIIESATGRTFRASGYYTNNAAETSFPQSKSADLSGTPIGWTIETTVIDGNEYVTNWTQ